jgi:hypothetical protein
MSKTIEPTNNSEQILQGSKLMEKDVQTKLGLPQKIYKDSEGLTHWYYSKSSQITSMAIGYALVAAARHDNASDDRYPKGGVEYVFDTSGNLLNSIQR